MELLKTSQHVAGRLHISQRRVQQLANELGIAKRYGKLLFSELDITAMRQRNRKVGRPNGKPKVKR